MAHEDNRGATISQALSGRILMVSNRLPVALEHDNEGAWRAEPASGGLVAALDPVMHQHGGVWVGWPGVAETNVDSLHDALDEIQGNTADYSLDAVPLSETEVEEFYEGFANQIIWPICHNRLSACHFEPDYWRTYQTVNGRFARHVRDRAATDDFIWVHDYHLMNVAADLRALGVNNRIGFFLHIPFPTVDILENLPWWREVLHSLLAFDFVGLQTISDRDNFIACVEALSGRVGKKGDRECIKLDIHDQALPTRSRNISVGALAISIDYAAVTRAASTDDAEAVLHTYRQSWPDRQMALGVDRLDYTKGLPHKLEAFRNAIERYPELQTRLSLHQHVIPSREQVPQYAEQKEEIERLVGEINGEFTTPGWVPIHYMFHRLNPAELMAYYRAADIALVTPLKDGMNLVAKEFCAAQMEEAGVLVLSEFAGAADELGDGALLVNPNDVEAMADRIIEAYRMDEAERARRMRPMRAHIRDNDAFDWVNRFLEAADVNS